MPQPTPSPDKTPKSALSALSRILCAPHIRRFLIIACGLILLWQGIIWLTGTPKFILPPPLTVAVKLWTARAQLAQHTLTTLNEIVLGLILGITVGSLTALFLQYSRILRQWLSPLLITSQAIPVYALAPVLTLWFGYGIVPKIVMTVLIIYFPITTAAYDGLRNTPQGYLDLARTMNASPLRILFRIRLPAALPSFASGLRVAVAIAPIGAIIGEWVGGSQGLGYLMTYANARSQSDLLFASLTVLVVITLSLYYLADRLLSLITKRYQSP